MLPAQDKERQPGRTGKHVSRPGQSFFEQLVHMPKVILCGLFNSLAGQAEVTVPAVEAWSLANLFAALCKRYPAVGEALLAESEPLRIRPEVAVLVNGRSVAGDLADRLIGEDDEIVVMLRISGG